MVCIDNLNAQLIQLQMILISRAHSFPRPAEFRAEPRNLGCRGIWTAEFNRGIRLFSAVSRGIWRFPFEQLIFHRKWPQSSSVTSLSMMIFCLMVMVEWWKWWIMNEQWRIHKFITCIWPVDSWFNQSAESRGISSALPRWAAEFTKFAAEFVKLCRGKLWALLVIPVWIQI